MHGIDRNARLPKAIRISSPLIGPRMNVRKSVCNKSIGDAGAACDQWSRRKTLASVESSELYMGGCSGGQ